MHNWHARVKKTNIVVQNVKTHETQPPTAKKLIFFARKTGILVNISTLDQVKILFSDFWHDI